MHEYWLKGESRELSPIGTDYSFKICYSVSFQNLHLPHLTGFLDKYCKRLQYLDFLVYLMTNPKVF